MTPQMLIMKKYNKAPHTLAVPAKRDPEKHQLHERLVCSSSSFAPNPNPGETEGLNPGGGMGTTGTQKKSEQWDPKIRPSFPISPDESQVYAVETGNVKLDLRSEFCFLLCWVF